MSQPQLPSANIGKPVRPAGIHADESGQRPLLGASFAGPGEADPVPCYRPEDFAGGSYGDGGTAVARRGPPGGFHEAFWRMREAGERRDALEEFIARRERAAARRAAAIAMPLGASIACLLWLVLQVLRGA